MQPGISIHIGVIHVHGVGHAEVLEAIANLEESIMTKLDTSTAKETADLDALIAAIGQLSALVVSLQSENNTELKAALAAANLDSDTQAAILDANDSKINAALTSVQALLNGGAAGGGTSGAPALVFTDQSFDVVTGVSVLDSIEASGGTGAITFVSSPFSQNGLSIDSAGELAGVSGADGSFNYDVTATDSGSPAQSVTAVITVISASAGGGNTDTGGNGTDTIIGGTGNDTLNGGNGGDTITGPEPLVLVTTALPDAVTGQSYAGSLEFSGGTGAVSVTSAPLSDNGVTISTDGSVSGTAAADADSTFSISFQDSADPPVTGTGTVTLHSAAAQGI